MILELGGKSACIYLAGGDLEIAVRRSLSTVFNNQGQTCSALTRLLVPREELYEVEEALLAYYQEHVKIGAPDKEDTTIGPLVSSTQRDTVMNYIQSGIEAEARLLIGGKSIDRVGYYVEPTIFTQVDNRMKIAQEEIFGPVLCVIPYDTVEEAIDLANDSIYGLSGCVVGPEDQAEAVARQLRTGNVFINDGYRNPRAPFGGYKLSGVGREIGLYGLEDYLEIKAILR